jgi:hypothetical protein
MTGAPSVGRVRLRQWDVLIDARLLFQGNDFTCDRRNVDFDLGHAVSHQPFAGRAGRALGPWAAWKRRGYERDQKTASFFTPMTLWVLLDRGRISVHRCGTRAISLPNRHENWSKHCM